MNSRDGSFIVDNEGNWRAVDRSYDGRVRGSWPWESSSATSDFVVIGAIDLTLTDDEIRAAYERLVTRDRS